MRIPVLLAVLAAGSAAQSIVYELAAPAGVRRYGHAVQGLSDLDGDGRPDFALSAAGMRVELHSGASGALLALRESAAPGYGHVLSRVGDVNADGVEDLLVGVPGPLVMYGFETSTAFPTPGLVEILSGSDLSVLRTLGEQAGTDDEFGFALAPLGDVSGDGVPDFAVGAPQDGYHYWAWDWDVTEVPPLGHVFTFSGADGALLWTAAGDVPMARFGIALAALPDMDGDGRTDLAVGASGNGPLLGRIHLLSGASGALLRTLPAPMIDSLTYPAQGFGGRLAAVPQPDGSARLLVGLAPFDYASWQGALLLDLPSGHLVAHAPMLGNQQYGLGAHVAAGDIDGDGRAELFIGSSFRSQLMLLDGECGWIGLLGKYAGASYPHVEDEADQFAACGSALGDVDGDGRPEFLVGEDSAGGDEWSYGRVRVYGGPASFTNVGHASPPTRTRPMLLPGATRGPGTPFSKDSRMVLYVSVPSLPLWEKGTPPTFTLERLVVGLQAAYMPWQGGVLVPSFDVSFSVVLWNSFPYEQLFEFDLPPAMPPGFEFWMQLVAQQPGGPPVFSEAYHAQIP